METETNTASTLSVEPLKQTLAVQAYHQLRDDIIRGTREPGERLKIEKLRTLYGIGPTPLREALQKLSTDRLVLSEGNRGFRVAPLSATEIQDLNIARTVIEKEATRLAMANRTNQWEADVVAAHYVLTKQDESLRSSTDPVPDSWERANAAFHDAIVSACGSAWLLRARASLADLVERYRRASLYQRTDDRDLNTEHAEILDAVLSGDADRASKLTEKHFNRTAQTLIETIVK